MKRRPIIKIVTSICLTLSTLAGLISPVRVEAASQYYTHSPLLSGNTMAVDEIDPWEMECFAVFLSNFCVPFVDSYATAFSSTSTIGSEGTGLDALQFATGGDLNSDSIIRRMITYTMENLANQYQPLCVKSYAINDINGNTILKSQAIGKSDTVEQDAEYRPAMLSDLLPILIGAVETNMSNVDYLKDNFDYNSNTKNIWSFSWLVGNTSIPSTEDMQDLVIGAGVLNEFYIANSAGQALNSDAIVFDMRNGWDIQVPSQCLLYAAYKNNGTYMNEIIDLINNAHTQMLYIDSIGNIVTEVEKEGSTEQVIIIPAYLNQHITANKSVCLLGSAVVNTVCTSSERNTVAGAVTGIRAVNNSKGEIVKFRTLLNAGIGSITHKYTSIRPGISFIYNTSADLMPAGADYGCEGRTTDGLSIGNPKLTNDVFNNFIRTGFDTSHLRWSTVVEHTADTKTGFDLQNTFEISVNEDKNYTSEKDEDKVWVQNKSGMVTAAHDIMTFNTVWSNILKLGNSAGSQYESLSAFQTAAGRRNRGPRTGSSTRPRARSP